MGIRGVHTRINLATRNISDYMMTGGYLCLECFPIYMYITLVLLFVLIFQLMLAYLTAEDAHSRGHSWSIWFISVLIFGVFAVLIHLLIREDTRLPESERTESNIEWGHWARKVGVIATLAVIGLFLSVQIGGMVAESIHPLPKEENYDRDTIEGNSEYLDEYFSQQTKRTDTRVIFGFFGTIFLPSIYSLKMWKSRRSG